jgi:lipopolysaccharide exporter
MDYPTGTQEADNKSNKDANFVRDVVKIAGGTTLAQVLSILASPVLTRLYGPDAYGLAALFNSILAIIGVVVCLRYELAIMLPKKDEEAANLLATCFISIALISLLLVPLIWFCGAPLAGLVNSPHLASYLWLLPLAVSASGAFLALNYWNSRTKQFGRLSIARIISAVVIVGIQLGAGLAGHATGGSLIMATMVGSAISALVLGVLIWRENGRLLVSSISLPHISAGVKRYQKFPIFDTWSALLNTICWQLPPFLLSAYFTSTIVGYYALGLGVLQLPVSLIGGAVGQVFFQRVSVAKYEGNLAHLTEDTVSNLTMLSIFPAMLLSVVGREAFIVIFGAKWAEAGVFAQILAIWIFFSFISSPISTLFSVLERQGSSMIFNLVLLPVRVGALVLGGFLGNARIAIALFSVTGVIVYVVLLLWIMAKVNASVGKLIKRSLKYLAYSLMLLIPIMSGKFIFNFSPQILLLVAVLASLVYYCIIAKTNKAILVPLQSMLRIMIV